MGVKPNEVSIIDLNTEEILHTIPIGKKPRGVAIDSGLNIALVSNSHDNTVSVINLTTAKFVKTIKVGESPRGIAVNERTHIAVVANHEDDNVSVIDLGTYRVIKKIKVGKEPRDVAIDSELNLALVVGKSKSLSLIDLSNYQVVGRIPLGGEFRAVSINPETHLGAVANDGKDTITIINLQNGETHFIPVDRHPIDVVINPLDNRALVLCNKERSLLLIDLNTNTILENYPLHKRSRGVAVNPFTNVAAVVDDKTDSVTLIELPNPVPVITSISPSAIPRGSKEIRILIEGSGFIKTSTVSILNSTLYSLPLNFIDNHRLEVIIPDNLFTKADIYKIVVANSAPDGGQSNPVNLQVNNPVPTLTSLDPSEVMAGTPGLTLTAKCHNIGNPKLVL
jgi:YVTN family beta-propeller protein